MDEKLPFQPYRSRRAFEHVADQIKQAILTKRLNDGDRLPPERKLAEQFEVGRVTVREALRTLETMGLIQIRMGSAGGAYVWASDPNSMPSMIMDRLQLDGTTHDQMIEARIGLECAIIGATVQHANNEDFAKIAQNVEESKEILEPLGARQAVSNMINFHILLAEASHNLPYIMFVRSIMEWAARELSDWIPSPDEQRYSHFSHRQILAAVQAGNTKSAEHLLREHIQKIGIVVSKRAQLKIPL